jgi:hypothetical protein
LLEDRRRGDFADTLDFSKLRAGSPKRLARGSEVVAETPMKRGADQSGEIEGYERLEIVHIPECPG